MRMKLEVKNLTKSFGEKEVLKDISFTAESGKALGLLGRNGAGKTTSIRIIMGVFYQNSGDILIDGKPFDREKHRVGYLPEERGLYPKQKIANQLIYFGMLRGLSKKEAVDNTMRWLERMGMSEYKDKKLETLSKGNQQKIQLAVTLLCDPRIVILDEPFSGLDPVNAMLLKDVIKEVINNGTMVILSSHQMNYIEEFCDDIAILNSGKIVLNGNINEIKRSYPRNTVEIGSLETNKIAPFIIRSMNSICDSVEEDEKNSVVRVKLKKAEDKMKLLDGLMKENFDIDSFKVCEPSLNNIFVEYTEGGI